MHRIILSAGLVLVLTACAFAQTGPALLLKPLLHEEETLETRGDALFLSNASTSNNADFRLSVYEVSGRIREQRERLIPRLGWEMTYLDVDSNDPALKNDLTDVSIAAGVEVGRYYDWQGALTLGIGYAGAAPFGDGNGWYAKGTLLFGRKLDKRTDIALVVDYDGNRAYYPDVPLPGFAYRHEFDPRLSYTIGLPVSAVTWKPFDPVTIDVTWTIYDSFDATIEYELSPDWAILANLETRLEGFHVDGIESDDRLLFRQRRVELGVRWKPWEEAQFTVAGGYAFGGEFSTGADHSDSVLVADISDEPYVRFGFQSRF
jgi:hypothetical protein